MAKKATILKIFVSSPVDVSEERKVLESVVRELNKTWSESFGIVLDLIRWETDAYPGFGEYPQAVVSKQICEDYDIFVGIMWKHFGTPTDKARSGTEEEFQDAFKKFKQNERKIRIMFYFCQKPIPPKDINTEQLKLINDFKAILGEKGGYYWDYTDVKDFEGFLRSHLSYQIQTYSKRWGVADKEGKPRETVTDEHIERDGVMLAAIDEDEQEELGFLDYIENGMENFELLTDVTKRITSGLEELPVQIKKRTDNMERIHLLDGSIDVKLAKKIARQLAEDMEQFTGIMKEGIPRFSKYYTRAVDSYGRASSLYPDFVSNNPQELIKALQVVRDLKESLINVRGPVLGNREIISDLPRITSVFNRAKRKLAEILDDFIIEIDSAINLTTDTEKVISDTIALYGDSANGIEPK